MTRRRLPRCAAALLLLCVTASCAYYNTFYLARKYYMKATDGQPYEVDREGTTQRTNYTKSSDYSKKLLGIYPKSKYVDDAWLMWARSLVGTDDPLKAVTMLQEFETRFPNSELRPDAEFFLGLAYRQARKHEQAVASFDEFLVQAPKHPLVPYAFYERSKAFMSLQRYREAAESASEILQRFPKHVIFNKVLRQRAEARFQQHDWVGARSDFHDIGARALSDEERLRFLLREVDCLESSRDYEAARALLRDARSHVLPPPPLPVALRVAVTPNPQGGSLPTTPPPASVTRTPIEERYGRLTLRMGGVELLAGRVDQAVEFYRSVLADYPRSQLAAEAQYRIAYAYETGAEDFARARAEYPKVREQTGTSQFVQQAQTRLDNLNRIDRYRTAAGADSLERKAEARFLVAEHYLFNLERPERALEEYQAIYDSVSIASVRARALNAQAWLLLHKLNRKDAADSLFWKVVREYPATQAQWAARDYLEADGQAVPESLIVAPKSITKPLLDDAEDLTKPPAGNSRLGARDEPSIKEPGAVQFGPGAASTASQLGSPSQWRSSTLNDSLRRSSSLRDSIVRAARADTSAAGRARVDSLRRVMAHSDTLGRGALMASIANEVERADHVVVAPDTSPAPNLSTAGKPGASTHASPKAGAAAVTAGAATAAAATTLPPAPRVGMPGPQPVKQQADSLRHAEHAAAAADSAQRAAHAQAMADSAQRAVRADSLHKSALSPKRVVAVPVVPVVPVVAPPAPGSNPHSITSWDSAPRIKTIKDMLKLTPAQRDSVKRDTQRREGARRDSLKQVSAQRDSLKRAAKHPSPPPPATAADSTQGRQP